MKRILSLVLISSTLLGNSPKLPPGTVSLINLGTPPVEAIGAGAVHEQAAPFVPEYCSRAIADFAFGPGTAGNKGSIASDIARLDLTEVERLQVILKALWLLMWPNYHATSAPTAVDPVIQMKIGYLVSHFGEGLAIPAPLREMIKDRSDTQKAKSRDYEKRIEIHTEKIERDHRIIYAPLSVKMMAQAVERLQGATMVAGVEGFLTSLLELIKMAVDDYTSVVEYVLELDLAQVDVFTTLAHVVLQKPELLSDPEIYYVLEALSVAFVNTNVDSLPLRADKTLSKLTRDEEARLHPAQKQQLSEALQLMWKWEDRLKQARASFGVSYPPARMCFYLVDAIARVNGYREVGPFNFLRASWIRDLSYRHKLWTLLTAHLLNARKLRSSGTDLEVDLSGLAPDAVLRLAQDPRMHERMVSQIFRSEYLLREYNESSRYYARLAEINSLEARLKDKDLAKKEALVSRVAKETAIQVLQSSSSTKALPAPLLSAVIGVLQQTDEASDGIPSRSVGKIRLLPENFRFNESSLRQVLESLDKKALNLFDSYTYLEKESVTITSPHPENNETYRSLVSDLNKSKMNLAMEVVGLLEPIERAISAQQGSQPKADARATLADAILHFAPNLACLIIHENNIPMVKGLQRRLVIGVLKEMLDRPDEFVSEVLDDTHVSRREASDNYVTETKRKRIRNIILWSVLGVSAAALAVGYHYFGSPSAEGPQPAIVQPGEGGEDPEPKDEPQKVKKKAQK